METFIDQIPQRKQHCPSHNNDTLVRVCPRQWVVVCGTERLGAWAAASRFVYMAPVGLLFQRPTDGTWPALSKTVQIAYSKDSQTFSSGRVTMFCYGAVVQFPILSFHIMWTGLK